MKRDEATYGGVRRKFEEWKEIQAHRPPPQRVLPPQRPYIPEPATDSEMGKTLFAGIGIGIGVILLVLAGLAFASAAKWAGFDRDGAAVGYSVVGFFLTIAGIGGIAATWNHNFRVLSPTHRRSQSH